MTRYPDQDDPIVIDSRQCHIFLNVGGHGPEHSAYLMPSDLLERFTAAVEARRQAMNLAVAAWLSRSPSAHRGQLVFEPSGDGGSVIRVYAGPSWQVSGAGPSVIEIPPINIVSRGEQEIAVRAAEQAGLAPDGGFWM